MVRGENRLINHGGNDRLDQKKVNDSWGGQSCTSVSCLLASGHHPVTSLPLTSQWCPPFRDQRKWSLFPSSPPSAVDVLMCLDRAFSVKTDGSFAALVPALAVFPWCRCPQSLGPARHARQIRIMEINFNIRRRHALTRGLTWQGNYYSLTLIMLLLNLNQGPAASLQWCKN